MKKIILFFILIILSSFVNAQYLEDYPNYFIDDDDDALDVIIVVGDKAPSTHVLAQTEIALSLSSLATARSLNLTKLASEVDDIDNLNIISIGNACDNEVTAEILGSPEPCNTGLEPGIASVELFETENNKIHIILNSLTDDGIQKLADVLSNYEDYGLSGNVFEIELDEAETPVEILVKEEVVPEEELGEEQTVEEEIQIEKEEKESVEEIAEDEKVEFEEEGPQPILKEEDDFMKKIIAWFLSLFGFLK